MTQVTRTEIAAQGMESLRGQDEILIPFPCVDVNATAEDVADYAASEIEATSDVDLVDSDDVQQAIMEYFDGMPPNAQDEYINAVTNNRDEDGEEIEPINLYIYLDISGEDA